ncbi:MAG: glycosyltransferase [Chlorogloeopsis fritschii C42_A2020_084]|uniref:glycosyltransferase n=1 Tax=Chlorogloeopsis fritschii TaxID=1124 RepID=UPI0019F8F09E|nr:glycosyltransferase [Chlorogloeopsis fritschii]MBF2005400.1 glycosyltransferase [Chlorogloeopsis fritschii C42_A2020_084]
MFTQMQNPLVSVIIPVFNDSQRLKLCLDALEKQTYPKYCYEIIVVDNASEENTEDIVSQFSQVILAYESNPGSYAARNKGISLAKGEIIAFTDSDCIPAQDWIDKGVTRLLEAPDCGLVGGKIQLFFRNPDKLTLVELYESVVAFPQKQYVQEIRFAVTANLFTFKSVLEKVGYFDSNLKSRGDLEWGQRVFRAGYKQIYADDVCVLHPARYTFSQLHQKIQRVAGGIYDLKTEKSVLKNFKEVYRDLRPPIEFIFKYLPDIKLNGINKKFQFVYVVLFIHYVRAWENMQLRLGANSKR